MRPPSPADLRRRLPALTLRDGHDLGRRLARAQRVDDPAAREAALADLAAAVAAAEARVAGRQAAVPVPSYPDGLPITAHRAQLLDAIGDHQVVIVAGETGSGKSTQLPKLCLELGRGVRGTIGHTQPRRLAARTIAERVADELGSPLGDTVGYTVRFSDQVGERTLVKLMTDGILLAEMQRDRLLRRYDTLIVDEAHERSLNIDFILGYVTDLLPRRPDLKVIVTSATIDTERFARHFDAPVVEVSGRSYPVEVRYRPIGEATSPAGPTASDPLDAIRGAVDELRAEGPGDVLVFLSGEREIRDAATALRDLHLPDTEVLPLYARLSPAEQHRVFRPHRGRRIVLATNVAETSITVPGIRYVVDLGTARISRYNRRTKVQRLPIEPISQASADQRAGRCGRVAPGVCIRLYAEDDLAARPAFTEPEILRTNLASVILQMAALGLGDVEAFPFVDPPDARSVRDAIALLVELGAMNDGRRLTPLGRRLARLPVDPRFGRMVLEAEANQAVHEVTVIAAALSIQDPRERPTGQEQLADEAHARFVDPTSDLVGLLNLWNHLQREQRERSSGRFRRMCRAEHLSYVRVREWQDLVRQLRDVTRDLGIRSNREPADPSRIHRSVLAGLLSHVGMRDREARDYLGARGHHFAVARGSALHRRSPAWVMAAELVETNRTWARTVAAIEPHWVEPLAGHLVRRTFAEPHWDGERGTAVTTERVTLYGLPVVAGRQVQLGRIDPARAREMFIAHALVEGDWRSQHPFVAHNRAVLDEVRQLEDRARRRDLLVDDDRLAAVFARRVPDDVTSSRDFDRWWRSAGRDRPHLLDLTRDDVVEPDAAGVDGEAFPTTWRQGDLTLDTSYTFGPGADDDGVTVHIPLAVLNRVSPAGFDWQVPGYRHDLVTAMIRSLPKGTRRRIAPAGQHAAVALAGTSPADGPLTAVLAGRLAAVTGEAVSPGDFDLDKVPPHLRVRFTVEDGDGELLASGRDLAALRRALREPAREAVAAVAAPSVERTGLTAWDLGELTPVIDVRADGRTVRGYPALVDEGETVGVRVMASTADQAEAMRSGLRRLALLAVPGARREAERRVRRVAALAALPANYPSVDALVDDCLAAAADRLVATSRPSTWDDEAARRLADAARGRLARLAAGAAGEAAELVATAVQLDRRLQSVTAPVLQPAVLDMLAQIGSLVAPGFVTRAGLERLSDIRRYLAAVRMRLDKLGERPHRDQVDMGRIQALEAAYRDRRASLPPGRRDAPDVVEVRWMLEELRVSLFAQTLGTPRPVSEKRIRRALAGLTSSP